MKRNFSDSSARSTAGCLPVPLFNQKKRNRQPLTSNPLKNEPSTKNSANTLDFSTMLTDFGWETAKPETAKLQKTLGINQSELSVPPSLLMHQNTLKPPGSSTGRKYRLEEKNVSGNVWGTKDYPAFGNRTENRMFPTLDDGLDGVMGTEFLEQQELLTGHLKASQSSNAGARECNYSAASQRPVGANSMLSTSYKFKHNLYQPKVYPNKTDHTQVDKNIQYNNTSESSPIQLSSLDVPTVYVLHPQRGRGGRTVIDGALRQRNICSITSGLHCNFIGSGKLNVPEHPLKLKEHDNLLRVLSVVIESMKHWSQYTNKVPLLFEVMGILDSAVTPGQYGAKTFLLRDGKESVSCVFYETDRELPRLIRGRAHRCMGNYDTKQKLFRCVSVRPATVLEQQTFQDFVKIADAEMSEYVKRTNEM